MIYTPGLTGNWRKTFHYKGASEAAAKKRAMQKPHARAVVATSHYLTEEDYVRTHGRYWERGL